MNKLCTYLRNSGSWASILLEVRSGCAQQQKVTSSTFSTDLVLDSTFKLLEAGSNFPCLQARENKHRSSLLPDDRAPDEARDIRGAHTVAPNGADVAVAQLFPTRMRSGEVPTRR